MSEIIKYRDFKIELSEIGIFFYSHKDFQYGDSRYGCAPTLEECKQEIDDWYKGEEDE